MEVDHEPKMVPSISELLDQNSRQLEELQKQLSNASQATVGNGINTIREYVYARERYSELVYDSLQLSLQAVTPSKDQASAKEIIREIETAIAWHVRQLYCFHYKGREDVVLEVWTQGDEVDLDKAYSNAIDTTFRKGLTGDYDLIEFRKGLIMVYQPDGGQDWSAGLWCPITKQYHRYDEVTAFQIVPCIIGLQPEEAHNNIWSPSNGLLMTKSLETAFNNRHLAIVPDSKDQDALNVVVLTTNEQHLNYKVCEDDGKPVLLRDLDNTRLQFLTPTRPAKRHLYALALYTVFARRRTAVDGWETDRDRVTSGKYWGPSGSLIPKSSVVSLAKEVGKITNLAEISYLLL
ncbi:uncharacterized protein K452DRAFT_345721 [Aplosporella prunicola CBS 121167]|uniref:HNH nuclease domain-containing protein n=1 Tax=Aplosporella prunicola CBS 121167 TaxID=1176127 RepID=A0A6A6BLF8_9PEZI|nr:uncharacterized protein K452DRAFT_345721 [Aplosporella prunicola CBS 121167]KAF2144233.1 hypothetical protein K452DRAFT_345721 [Aplosporella prunicola CBS 121167]